MTDLAGDVTALINRLSVVQAQRDTARQELATARAEVERLKDALNDIKNVGAKHSDEMIAVGYCVGRAATALEPPAPDTRPDDTNKE